jgi:hypothetical protein
VAPQHDLFSDFKKIEEAELETSSVYWYDKHDFQIRGISMSDFLDDRHWEHITQDPTSKILLYYGDEYLNLSDIEMCADTIKTKKLNPSQIYFIVIDLNWSKWVITQFEKRGIIGINVTDHNLLLKKTMDAETASTLLQLVKKYVADNVLSLTRQNKLPKVKKKFSGFSRRFDHWRLQLFTKLFLKNLLPNFKYTFNNIDPYAGIGVNNIVRVFKKEEILEILASKNYDLALVKDWINDMPYTFPEKSSFNKWTTNAHQWVKDSAFHLLIESHYDPFNHFQEYKNQYEIKEFSPSLITEKAWKVIVSCRPFIVFSTPYYLEDLKSLGFKTFHPYIDESYDRIENQNKRMDAIINEVDKLNNLSTDEFDYVFKECYNIALENYEISKKLYSEIKFENNFSWVNQYLNKDIK